MASAVVCLFQILQPCTTSAVLGHSKWIVERVRKSRLRSTRLALYEGVKSLIEKFSKTKEDGRRYEADEDKRGVAVFTGTLAAELLDDNGEPATAVQLESEDLRIARLQMALALVQSDVARALSRGELGSILKVWLEKERSRSIRQPLQNAILALEERESAAAEPGPFRTPSQSWSD